MIQDPLKEIADSIKCNYFQQDIEDKFYDYGKFCERVFEQNYPLIWLKVDYDEKNEIYYFQEQNPGEEIRHYSKTKDQYLKGYSMDPLVDNIISKLRTYIRHTDYSAWGTLAVNFQLELSKFEKKLKADKIPYFHLYLECLSAVSLFLSNEYIEDKQKAAKGSPNYKVLVRGSYAIKCFYKQLVHFRFIKDRKVPFNQFFAGKPLDEKIQWLTTATDFNAFMKHLCEKGYIEFPLQTKWNTLKEIFLLPNSRVAWDKIAALKPPKAKVLEQLKICFHELES